MCFKEQLWDIIQKENPREELMTFQKMKAEFDDVCTTLVSTLTPEQKKWFEEIVFEIVKRIAEYSVRLSYDTTFTVMNQMWSELIFGDKIPYLSFKDAVDNV